MYCTKCGKEIPDGENKLCEDCQAKLVAEIKSEDDSPIQEPKKAKKTRKKETKEVVEEVKETKKGTKKESKKESKKDSKKETKKSTKNVKTEEKKEEDGKKFEVAGKKKKGKKVFAIILVILVLVAAIATVWMSGILVPHQETGNTIGNILNNGYTVENDKYIYFIAPDETLKNICIYRSDKDGSNTKELYKTESSLNSINLVGNYLYFLSLTEVTDELGMATIDNKICKMKVDGTGFKVLNDNEFHDYCYEIYVVMDRIYYIGEDVNVYTMDLEGGDRTLALDKGTGYVAVTKDYIVYNDYVNGDKTSEEFETFIYNMTTKESNVIEKGKKTFSTTILGNEVYYTAEDGAIYKKSLDNLAADATLIYDTEAYYMNVSEHGIYYMNYTSEEDQTISIFSLNLDGTDHKVLKTFASLNGGSFINVVSDWVVFTDSDNVDLYMSFVDRLTGQNEKRVFSININEYWSTYMTEEETEETVEESTDISLDTTVDEIENTTKK